MKQHILYLLNILHNLICLPILYLKKNKLPITTVSLQSGSQIRNCIINDYVYISNNCILNDVEIGDYSCIGAGVQIGGMEHPYWDKTISPKLSNEYVFGNKTIIGHDVWIGANVIIKQGVKIGNGAVIGACSFVNKDVPSYAIVFGIPAKLYKYRDCKKLEDKLENSKYWKNTPGRAKDLLSQIN